MQKEPLQKRGAKKAPTVNKRKILLKIFFCKVGGLTHFLGPNHVEKAGFLPEPDSLMTVVGRNVFYELITVCSDK